jgi:ribonucleoside-diphosphate reductase alpha chain
LVESVMGGHSLKVSELDYHSLNAMLNLYDAEGQIQFDKDKEAARQYFLQHVNPKTYWHHTFEERIKYLIDNDYYEARLIQKYGVPFIKQLTKEVYSFKFRFPTFLGAYKFYNQYALKTNDGDTYLERYEDRVVMVALGLAEGANDPEADARLFATLMITQQFQPATPTFLNMGKVQRGEYVSCFLISATDNMESITQVISSSLQLSKRGGGVGVHLSNLREFGAPIKGIENAASGVIPVMKILEDSFSYANQLGARQGAGAVYLHAHHPDIMRFLDTKRENADEKIRIKTLSLGVVIPDITFELARNGEDMYLFSPYDVERVYGVPFSEISVTEKYHEMVDNPEIKKTRVNTRTFFQTIAEIQFESGYPYIMYEDTVNRAHNIPGKVQFSNLCSEILQVTEGSEFAEDGTYTKVGRDISCNLGSLNIANVMFQGDAAAAIRGSVRALTAVSDMTEIGVVPTVAKGNKLSHAIGLGQMNLHGFLAHEGIEYGSPEAIEFIHAYASTVTYHAIDASRKIAVERGETFKDFHKSKYATGEFFDKYTETSYEPQSQTVIDLMDKFNFLVAGPEDWAALKIRVMQDGMYNAYLQAVAPTGSISYVQSATSSIHPITSEIEIRKEGKLGRVYYPAPYLTNRNREMFKDAYEVGPEKIIDTYAAFQEHIDQGLSLTLFFKDTATTRDINRAQIYAWRKGIKTLYYIRVRQDALEGTDMEECVSCTI